jgi:hypothetical protein
MQTQGAQGGCQVIVDFRGIRAQSGGGSVFGDCLGVAAKHTVCSGKTVVMRRAAGCKSHGSSDHLNAWLRLSFLSGDQAKQMQAFGVVRIAGQDVAVKCFRLIDPTGLVVRQCGGERESCVTGHRVACNTW